MIVDVIHCSCAPVMRLHGAAGRQLICNKLGDFTVKVHFPGKNAMQYGAHAV